MTMFIGAQLSELQYNKLKNSSAGDRLAIIDYWDDEDEEDNTNLLGHDVYLEYGDFVIKTVVLSQLKNCKSKLPLYEIRPEYRDEPLSHDLNDEPFQSIELEIVDIWLPEKEEVHIVKPKRRTYGFEEFAMYNRILRGSLRYSC